MTTAHRPTFDPARGKEAQRGEAYHQRLQPAYKSLKFRQSTQGAPNEQARRDLRAELLRKERIHTAKKEGREIVEEEEQISDRQPLALEDGNDESTSLKRKNDDDVVKGEDENQEDYEAKKRRVLEENKDIDADSEDSSSSEESEDDEEDETAELMRELAKIKVERAEAAVKEVAVQAAKDEEQRERDIALGNPLLNSQDYGVKRRWDDDVVFKNQARGTEERGKEKRFVNDLLRSDFHRRFMDKYVR